ncbi:MAG TPA: RNA-binding protein [Firmicutes bacterium]|jgi:ribosomal protein L14E/L6E/L27E|uniref:KOW domain-containing RNA-binding protein n=1 Tax=Gelria sp. Kuro-4 TaxID=2796927 RepID=UPI0019BF7BFB|nr:KOW domain-containing RNA-binding protein [Gelria sp. Kuro-4]MDI3522688.1 hypothetical protein [Bacillota bacterium]MDK2926788.1 hypothetical protein [Bacillota bacterium]BCV24300.1 hypothetical protein kuro4_10730 [Gelria sp. Kuro-4]HHV56874.1 RNA-binding protein [Bacillota bacterium]
MPGKVKLGQIVCSRAGRDRGRYYLVVGWQDARRLRVADGRRRPVERPKVKNIAHLEVTGRVAEEVAARLERKEPVSDLMVRAALAEVAGADPSWKEGD